MQELKELIAEKNFRFNKAYGQNFITDTNLLRAIVADAGVERGDTVLEVGPGAGTLTRELAASCKRVVAFEIDGGLAPILAETLSGVTNCEIYYEDFMKATDSRVAALMGGAFKVVANLPYYITTPLVMRFLESGLQAESVTVMVQREVADRFVARPGTPEYGALTVAVDAAGTARMTRPVSRKLFYPVPNVDSAVVRIDRADKYGIDNYPFFQKVYRAAFAMRRKTLANNLMSAFSLTREQAARALAEAGLEGSVRGECLDTAAFVRLSSALKNNLETR